MIWCLLLSLVTSSQLLERCTQMWVAHSATVANDTEDTKKGACFVAKSWDRKIHAFEEKVFAASFDQRVKWKFSIENFVSDRACFRAADDFVASHAFDTIITNCETEKPFAVTYTAWYFLRADWQLDTRTEQQLLHGSELDCPLGSMDLSHGFFTTISKGKRDSRLCSHDSVGEAKVESYGNAFAISPVTKEFYRSLILHDIFTILMLGLLTTISVCIHTGRIEISPKMFDNGIIRLFKYIFTAFLFSLPYHIYTFYKEPFNSTYMLDHTGWRLNGGILNALVFSPSCLTMAMFFINTTPELKALITRRSSTVSCILSTILTPMSMSYGVTSKYQADVVVLFALTMIAIGGLIMNVKLTQVNETLFTVPMNFAIFLWYFNTSLCFGVCWIMAISCNLYPPSIPIRFVLPASIAVIAILDMIHPKKDFDLIEKLSMEFVKEHNEEKSIQRGNFDEFILDMLPPQLHALLAPTFQILRQRLHNFGASKTVSEKLLFYKQKEY